MNHCQGLFIPLSEKDSDCTLANLSCFSVFDTEKLVFFSVIDQNVFEMTEKIKSFWSECLKI